MPRTEEEKNLAPFVKALEADPDEGKYVLVLPQRGGTPSEGETEEPHFALSQQGCVRGKPKVSEVSEVPVSWVPQEMNRRRFLYYASAIFFGSVGGWTIYNYLLTAGPVKKVDSKVVQKNVVGDDVVASVSAEKVLGWEPLQIKCVLPIDTRTVLPIDYVPVPEIDTALVSDAWKNVLTYPFAGFASEDDVVSFENSLNFLLEVTPPDDLQAISKELILQMVSSGFRKDQAVIAGRIGGLAMELCPQMLPAFQANVMYLNKLWQAEEAKSAQSAKNEPLPKNEPKPLPQESVVENVNELANKLVKPEKPKEPTPATIKAGMAVSPIGIWEFFNDLKDMFSVADSLQATAGPAVYEVAEVNGNGGNVPGVTFNKLPFGLTWVKFRVIYGNTPEVFLWAVTPADFQIGDRIIGTRVFGEQTKDLLEYVFDIKR